MKSQPFDAKTDIFPDVLLINNWKKKRMHGPLLSEKEVLVYVKYCFSRDFYNVTLYCLLYKFQRENDLETSKFWA